MYINLNIPWLLKNIVHDLYLINFRRPSWLIFVQVDQVIANILNVDTILSIEHTSLAFPIPTHFSANNNAIFKVTKLLFQSVCAVLEWALKILAIKAKYRVLPRVNDI